MVGEALEIQVGPLLRQQNLKLAAAESCTGGLIGHRVTNVPGSSDYYLGSIIAYSYEAKERLLGVKHATLQTYGAVSQETVLEMAHGVRTVFSPDFPMEKIIGISVSGIAGPGGGLPGKPVGLVWIGLDRPGYGMHGTPNPEQVGRTESHGCFRLANWDAETLLSLAWVGLPVSVEP